MIKLGVNTVLFKDFTFGEACTAIAAAGYDGVEISAIKGMCEHLDPENWREQKAYIKACLNFTGMKILSSEVASQDPDRLRKAFEAAVELEIPVIGIGAGAGCDGQVLVWQDMLGLCDRATPKFVKQFGQVGAAMREAVTAYIDEVRSGAFPQPEHCYAVEEEAEMLSRLY